MSYTIAGFWTQRLERVVRPKELLKLPGWSIELQPNPWFVEAELGLREGLNELRSPIWLVAAPGAVGKSTLAKEISARTGAIYLDLAKADTVAGNYITGGLVKNDLLELWRAERSALLIDALDEARLRVTQKSFEDFLADVVSQATGRMTPTVLFGRVAIIEEAWTILAERDLECPIFDIALFDAAKARQFVVSALHRLAQKPGNSGLAKALLGHKSVYESAAALFVDGLEKLATLDGTRFAGYAPVLEAVATVLATVSNPARLSSAVEETLQGRVLHDIAHRILSREATKLRDALPAEIPDSARGKLYGDEEQLARLAALVFGLPLAMPKVELEQQYIPLYDEAVGSFISQHPFLDGTGRAPSGAVFGAVLIAQALFSKSKEVVEAAERHAGHGPYTPNPFLFDFYLANAGSDPLVPPEHVVALYESLRARASAHDVLHLSVEGNDNDDSADVEIELTAAGDPKPSTQIALRTSQAGVLRFGRQVRDVHVDAPLLDVVIGTGSPVEMVAPVTITVAQIAFKCPELVVATADLTPGREDVVILEAQQPVDYEILGAPVVRKGVTLVVAWPGSAVYPWVQYSNPHATVDDPNLHDVLLRLRKLVMSFRSHSKGRLARFRGKIEHSRMTKGDLGVALRKRLIADGVLSLEEEMYFLDPQALGTVVGASYQDLNQRRFNEKVRRYVATIIAGNGA